MNSKVLTALSIMIISGMYCSNSFATIDNSASIDNALSQDSGIINVNLNSGDFNLQANTKAISISPDGFSNAQTITIQEHEKNQYKNLIPENNRASIGPHAFSNDTGFLSINEVAGLGNSQANQASISIGAKGSSATDVLLESSASNSSAQAPVNYGTQWVGVADTAFEGTTGIVQLNQVAGIGNATANSFNVRIGP